MDRLRLMTMVAAVAFPLQGLCGPLSSDEDLPATLQARLDAAYGEIWKEKDAAKFVDYFFSKDAILTGSDGPKVWKGRVECRQAVAGLMRAFSAIQTKVRYTRLLAPSAAFQFVEFDATSEGAGGREVHTIAKSLYVWVKTPKGWLVAADHYSFAGMDARQLAPLGVGSDSTMQH